MYFAADIERVSNEEFNDSLDRGQEAESVGRKGSFKVLRPRVISQECLVQPQQEDLKELSMIGHTHNTHVTMTKTPSEEEQ